MRHICKQKEYDESVELLLNKNYSNAYKIIFDKLQKEPDNQEVICYLGLYATITGSKEVSQFYIEKIGYQNFIQFVVELNNIELLQLVLFNDNEHKRWDNYRRKRNANEINRFGVTAPLCSGNVLEIGCANGDLSSIISMHVDNHFGIDIDPVAIELARLKAYDYGLDNCYFNLGDGSNLDYNDNSFDTVVLAEVLEHVNDPNIFIKEAFRVCKPGGKVIISVPRGYSIPDQDHLRIFTIDLLESMVSNFTNQKINWIDEVPNCWILGYIIKEEEHSITTSNLHEIESKFLPQHLLTDLDYNERVSIIIPTYNREEYIVDSLESVLSQTYPNKEIIVVNDGSTDNTEGVLTNYFDRIIYLNKENGGKASAINYALSVASGQYIWVFDDDDIALPKKLELQIRKFQVDKKIGLIHTSAIFLQEHEGTKKYSGMYQAMNLEKEQVLRAKLNGNHFFTPSVIVRKECFDKVGKWDEEFVRAEDYDMWARIARYYEVGVLPIPTLHYRIHDGVRGSKDDPIQVSEVYERTKKYDQLIRKKMHQLPIEIIFPTSMNRSSAAALVESYLERALYMINNELIEECIEDLENAKLAAGDTIYLNFSARGLTIVDQLYKVIDQVGDSSALVIILYFVKMIKRGNHIK